MRAPRACSVLAIVMLTLAAVAAGAPVNVVAPDTSTDVTAETDSFMEMHASTVRFTSDI